MFIVFQQADRLIATGYRRNANKVLGGFVPGLNGVRMNQNSRPVGQPLQRPPGTQFAFPAPAAQRVSLAGDFNDWDSKSIPMRRGHDGVWRKNMSLKPGRHEYRFIADGEWLDDPAAGQRIANAFGTENCVIIVAGETPPNIVKKRSLARKWGVTKSNKLTENDL